MSGFYIRTGGRNGEHRVFPGKFMYYCRNVETIDEGQVTMICGRVWYIKKYKEKHFERPNEWVIVHTFMHKENAKKHLETLNINQAAERL